MTQLTFGDLPIHDTLADARAHVNAERFKPGGVRCPCCDLFVKVYRRKLNSGIALGLLALWKLRNSGLPQTYYHVNAIARTLERMGTRNQLAAAQIPLARFWGLVEEKRNADTSKSQSGEWRLTAAGEIFVQGGGVISKYIIVFNNHVLSTSDEKVFIQACLGHNFNFQELMEGV